MIRLFASLVVLVLSAPTAEPPLTVKKALVLHYYAGRPYGPWVVVDVQNNSGKIIVGEKFKEVTIDATGDPHEWPWNLTSSQKIKPGKTQTLFWEEPANQDKKVEVTLLKVMFEDGSTWESDK